MATFEQNFKDKFDKEKWAVRKGQRRIRVVLPPEDAKLDVLCVFAGPSSNCIYEGQDWDPLKHKNGEWCPTALEFNKILQSETDNAVRKMLLIAFAYILI